MAGPGEARRKELLRQYKGAEKATARERLGLTADALASLLDYLDGHLGDAGCDHTLRLTQRWAEEQGRAVETITTSVRGFGGYCDCKVLANVTPDKFGWPD